MSSQSLYHHCAKDIHELVRYYVDRFASSMNKTIDTIPEEAMQSLILYPWPGNIRELQNYVARSVILSNDGVFKPAPLERCEAACSPVPYPTLEETLRREILVACQQANWKIGGPRGAAARLGLKRTTLSHKLKRLGIAPPADFWWERPW